MSKNPLSDIRELLAKAIFARASERAFSKLPTGLTDLYINHYDLKSELKNLAQNNPDPALAGIFEAMVLNLDTNMEVLLKMAGDLANRKVLVHETSEDDTLWGLSRKYDSEIQEICEINNVKNVLKPNEKRFLLIPLK